MNATDTVSEPISVIISDDRMQAALLLRERDFEVKGEYTLEEVLETVKAKGVRYGIKEKAIAKIIQEKRYNKHYVIAQGLNVRQGRDGYFEYYFNVKAQTGIPKIMDDGRVDYSQIIELVRKDDVIVEYFPADRGDPGYKVTGDMIMPDKVKEQEALRGSGYVKDGHKYRAIHDGRVTLHGIRLEVSPVLIIEGNVNLAYGDVEFNGDIFVRGDVAGGVTVKAEGGVIVDGNVEAATICAGKECIIGHGVHGDNDVEIRAGGRVSSYFIEGAKIVADGEIMAATIVNSDIFSKEAIDVTASKGVIMGGMICGMTGVKANVIGHRSGLATNIYAGASEEDTEVKHKLSKTINACMLQEKRLKAEGERLEKRLKMEKDAELTKRKEEVDAELVQLTNQLAKSNWELDELLQKIKYAENSKVLIRKMLHPGVKITIGTVAAAQMSGISDVCFKQDGVKIIIESIDGRKPIPLPNGADVSENTLDNEKDS